MEKKIYKAFFDVGNYTIRLSLATDTQFITSQSERYWRLVAIYYETKRR